MIRTSPDTYFKKTVITLVLILTGLTAASYGQTEQSRIWSEGSAYILPVKRVELGLFQPLRYGQSEQFEWSTQPIFFFILPNFNLKWFHTFYKDIAIASQYGVYYPTLVMRTLAREGTGGIISPEFDIPHMLGLSAEIIISKPLTDNILLSAKGGLALGVKSAGLDERTTIDLPLIYSRLAIFYHGYQLRSGLDLDGQFNDYWHYALDADFFYTPGVEHNSAFEHKGLLIWQKSAQTKISLGYKLVYGDYPFGRQWHLLLPLIDIQKAWTRD